MSYLFSPRQCLIFISRFLAWRIAVALLLTWAGAVFAGPSPRLPDLSLRPSTMTTYAGTGIYNLDGTGQTVNQSVANGVKASYYVLVKNNGNISDTYIITGPAALTGWTVTYNLGATSITSAVTSTGWTTPVLNPAATLLLTVYVTPGSSVVGGEAATQKVTVTSNGDPTQQDVGIMQTTLPVLRRPDLYLRPSTVSSYLGSGVYNLDGVRQTVGLTVTIGVKAIYYVTVKNTGNIPDSFTITGPAGPVGWTVTYNVGSTSITGAMITTGWPTPVLNPAATVLITVYVTPNASATWSVPATQTMTVTSNSDRTKRDVGVLKTTLPAPNRPDLSLRSSTVLAESGIGVYNLDGTDQTVGQSVGREDVPMRGATVSYFLTVRNNGTVADTFTITGTSAPLGWTLVYTTSATDITNEVTTTGWMTPELPPTDSVLITVTVSPGPTVLGNTATTQVVTATSAGNPTQQDVGKIVTTYPILHRPDITIRPATVSSYTGVGIYNLDGTNQTVEQLVPAGTPATYYLSVRNYGNIPEAFTLSGSAVPVGWTITFKNGATVISGMLTTTGWSTPIINPAKTVLITVDVTPGFNVMGGILATQSITVTSSGDPTKQDVGLLRTTTILQAPILNGFTPSRGLKGQEVTLIGANLTGVTAVSFNGVNAESFTDVSATAITAIVPNGATTGKIVVITPAGSVSSATNFMVAGVNSTPGTYFYVSNTGDDANDGTSELSPWKTIAKVNASTFFPADRIYFKRGDMWRETLTVSSSGAEGSPIIFGAYGAGANPEINGSQQIPNSAFIPLNAGVRVIFDAPVTADSHTSGTGNQRAECLAAANSPTVKVRLSASDSGDFSVGAVSISEQLSGHDAAAAPVRVLWDGGSTTTTIRAGSYKDSDALPFSITAGKKYLIHVYYTNKYFKTGREVNYFDANNVDETMEQTPHGTALAVGSSNGGLVTQLVGDVFSVYRSACSSDPVAVWEDGQALTESATPLTGTNGSWYWDGSTYLYICASDGSNVGTNNRLYEKVSLWYNIDDNKQSWLEFQDINCSRSGHKTPGFAASTVVGVRIGGTHNLLHDMELYSNHGHAISLYEAQDCRVYRCKIHDSTLTAVIAVYGYQVANACTRNVIEHCEIYQKNDACRYWPIVLHGKAVANIIQYNDIYLDTTQPTSLIMSYDNGTSNTIRYNYLHCKKGYIVHAIWIKSVGLPAGAGPYYIYGNVIDMTSKNGLLSRNAICFEDAQGQSEVYDNDIISTNASYALINISNTPNVKLHHNNLGGPFLLNVLPDSQSGFNSDQNNFYPSSNYTFMWGSMKHATLPAWITATGQDANSTSIPFIIDGPTVLTGVEE